MKTFIAIAASLLTMVPVASADGRWHGPVHSDRGSNPWPFIAGAVVGGIIVHSAEASQPRVVSPRQPEPPVLINGVWMQRTYQCVQDIIVDRYGNEQLMNRCNWVFVPVQIQPSN